MGRPRKPKGTHYVTRPRSHRFPEDIYEAAQRTAAKRGETVTDVLVAFLERYGREERQRPPEEP